MRDKEAEHITEREDGNYFDIPGDEGDSESCQESYCKK